MTPNAFKGALSGLRQGLATESPLKTMKYVFFFFFAFNPSVPGVH